MMAQRTKTKEQFIRSWKQEVRFIYAIEHGKCDRQLHEKLKAAIEELEHLVERFGDDLEARGAWKKEASIVKVVCKYCGNEFETDSLTTFAEKRVCSSCFVKFDRIASVENPCKGCKRRSCFDCQIFIEAGNL